MYGRCHSQKVMGGFSIQIVVKTTDGYDVVKCLLKARINQHESCFLAHGYFAMLYV